MFIEVNIYKVRNKPAVFSANTYLFNYKI